MNQANFKDGWATIALAVIVGLLFVGKLTGAEFVNAFTWLASVYLLGQAAGVVAQGWVAQTVVRAPAAASAPGAPRG